MARAVKGIVARHVYYWRIKQVSLNGIDRGTSVKVLLDVYRNMHPEVLLEPTNSMDPQQQLLRSVTNVAKLLGMRLY